MRGATYLAACLAAAPVIVSAHGIPGAPKIFGRHPLVDIPGLKARNMFDSTMEKRTPTPVGPQLDERANVDGQCGASYGSCAAGYCCSPAGYCGKGPDYCNAPDCQFNYGSGCDANKSPAGDSTSTVARPKLGNVLYGGEGIYECTVPGTVAITYDDGPYIYTSDILDILKARNAKATFFMTGINNGKGQIDNASTIYPAIIRRMYADGHQLASHTWSHQDLSAITQQQRKDQMYKLERALANIVGFFPTYMRPPYSSCTGQCETDMAALGYHISYFNVDTDDYDNDSPTLIQNAKNNFVNGISGGTPQNNEYLTIAHDIHEQTAHNLTAFMLDQIYSRGYRAVTMGECLGDGPSNWYRTLGGAPVSTPVTTVVTPVKTSTSVSPTGTQVTASPTSTTTVRIISPDGSCGGASNYTCSGSAFGGCCSSYGWCGATDAYCGNGCNALFGSCNNGASVTVSSSIKTTTTSSPNQSTLKSTSTVTTSKPSTSTVATSKPPTSSTPALPKSNDGSCGTKATCQGSTFGNCCSQYGYCGSTANYCGTGCQKAYGTCT